MRPSLIAMLAAAGLAWTAGASAQSVSDPAAPPPQAAADGTAAAPADAAASASADIAPSTPAPIGQESPGSASTGSASMAPAPMRSGSMAPSATLASTTGTAVNTQSASVPVSGAQASKPPRKHLSWEQRFAQANTTGDGRLTLEQAKAGYVAVARHFKEIDLDGKGWVTTDDIRAWHKAQRAARQAAKAAAAAAPAGNTGGEALRPRPAYHRTFPNAQQGTTADPAPGPVDGRRPEDPS